MTPVERRSARKERGVAFDGAKPRMRRIVYSLSIAIAAAALAGIGAMDSLGIRALESAARADPGLACYVALANDLTPLIDPTAPDLAAASPECAQSASSAPQSR